MRVTGFVTGVGETVAALGAANQQVRAGVSRAMKRTALGGQSIVRGKARGRPGPRAVTGDYNRSIVGESTEAGDVATAAIGSNAPQTLRLEFGFFGPDALGRVYNQAPLPHFGPSVPEVEELAVAEITAAVKF